MPLRARHRLPSRRAGREVLLVVNREFIDYTGNYDFRSMTGDVTFKFSYTFRF